MVPGTAYRINNIIYCDIKTHLKYHWCLKNEDTKLVTLCINNEPLFLGKCIHRIKTDRICFYLEIIGGGSIITRDGWASPCIKIKLLNLLHNDSPVHRTRKREYEEIDG